MAHKISSLILIVGILHLFIEVHSRFEFTNVICNSVDAKFGEFDYCFLKSVNRTYKYFSGKFKVYQLPVRAMEVNMAISKRFNGYKPFLYNITFDACKFLANPKSSPVVKFFHESFMNYSSVNHSCPYNHDLVLDKLPVDFINYRFTKILPFPEGQYILEVRWLRSGSLLAVVKLYGLLS